MGDLNHTFGSTFHDNVMPTTEAKTATAQRRIDMDKRGHEPFAAVEAEAVEGGV